jgi:hypothetical protein
MLQTPDAKTKKLLELADFIENLEEDRFSMRSWGQTGEPRCICGWFLYREGYFNCADWLEAADRLGLDGKTASHLFHIQEWDTRQAAKVLRHLAVTGELEE